MSRLRCDECRWWDDQHPRLEGVDPGNAYCRKKYPMIFHHANRYWAGWPIVNAADYCGEHKALEG